MAGVTLLEVASEAGVSLATASRVLNGSSRVPGADVAERVRAAALDLGYVANAQAQALARSSTGLVGLVVHDIADPYFSTIAEGVQRGARAGGRQVLLASTERNPQFELEAVAALVAHRADAIILAGSRWESPDRSDDGLLRILERYRTHGGRLAAIGQPLPTGHAVVPHNRASARALGRQLVAQGHRRFALLAGPQHQVTARMRADGFAQALSESDIPLLDRVASDFTRDGGYEAITTLVDRLGLSGAGVSEQVCVFAVNDVMAVGAMAALRDLGLRVPQDVGIAGFDDIPTLRDYLPAVTTVRLPLALMGERALALATEPGDSTARLIEPVDGIVILRESTQLTATEEADH